MQTRHSDVAGNQSNRIAATFIATDAEHSKLALSQGVLCYVVDAQKMCLHDGVTKGGILCVDASGLVPADKFLQSVGNYNPATNVLNFYLSDGTTIMADMTDLINDIIASVPNKHVAATMLSPSGTVSVAATGTDFQTFSVDVNIANTVNSMVGTPATLLTLQNAINTDDQTATEVPVGPAVRGQVNVQAALEALDAAIPLTTPPSGPAGGGLTGAYPNPGLNAAAVNAAVTVAADTTYGKVQLAVQPNFPQHANDVDATTPAYVKAAIDAAIGALPLDVRLVGLQSYNAATNIAVFALSDGSTVAVDWTALITDAVASVPNKHVAATLSSPDGSIAVTFSGIDGQTFTVQTTASLVPVVDSAGNFASSNVEDVLAEIYALILAAGGIQTATQTPVAPAVLGQVNVQAALQALAAASHPAAALSASNGGIDVVFNAGTQVGTFGLNAAGAATLLAGSPAAVAILQAAIDTDTDNQTASQVLVAPSVLGAVDVQAALQALAAVPDLSISGMSFAPATGILTVTRSDGTLFTATLSDIECAAAAGPPSVIDPAIPTTRIGSNAAYLGNPDGWFSINGKKVPYWN